MAHRVSAYAQAEEDFGPGCRGVIVYCVEKEGPLILRVVHGRRDLDTLFAP